MLFIVIKLCNVYACQRDRIVYLKPMQLLLVNYTSVKLQKGITKMAIGFLYALYCREQRLSHEIGPRAGESFTLYYLCSSIHSFFTALSHIVLTSTNHHSPLTPLNLGLPSLPHIFSPFFAYLFNISCEIPHYFFYIHNLILLLEILHLHLLSHSGEQS